MTSAGRSAIALPLVVRTTRSERAAASSPSLAPSHATNRQVMACVVAVCRRAFVLLAAPAMNAARRLHVGRAPGWLAVHLCGRPSPFPGS